MKPENKYNFEDLNSFVNGRFEDLRDDHEIFCNQLIGLTETLTLLMSSRSKLEALCTRLVYLKQHQECIDGILNLVEKWQNVWEQKLICFEQKCKCDAFEPEDKHRSAIYELADKVFASLKNYYEMLEGVESKVSDCVQASQQESVSLLSQVLNGNLHLLEKLYVHIQKLNYWVDFNEGFLVKRCFCNRSF